MNVHVLQHVPFEDIGSMAHWLSSRATSLAYTKFFESTELPDPEGLDLIIAMGGPMSVNDEAELPWLIREKQFLRTAMERGVAIVGVCLGAQLIASALGATVYQGAHKEIGWFEIAAVPGGNDVFTFPDSVTVFHWHGETFDLPAGAIHLAKSAACAHQAFQVGRNVIGLQFHLETTRHSLDAITTHCREELVPAPFIQTEAELRAAPPECFATINALMASVLSYVTRP